MKIVALGGGTGLATLLRGFWLCADAIPNGSLSAIVTVTDDGGSSGRLFEEFGVLPPGDFRSCLVAMADPEHPMARLFDHRFDGKGPLAGHSLGNLLIAALAQIHSGDFVRALLSAGELLKVPARVLPSSREPVELVFECAEGIRVRGESRLASRQPRTPIEGIALRRRSATGKGDAPIEAFPGVIAALLEADLIVLGPGSLFTSVISNLLIPGIQSAVRDQWEKVVYVCNLMTEPGETDGFSVSDHVEALIRYGDVVPRWVLINQEMPQGETLTRYQASGAEPVKGNTQGLECWKPHITFIERPLLGEWLQKSREEGKWVLRHHSERLALTILELLCFRNKLKIPTTRIPRALLEVSERR